MSSNIKNKINLLKLIHLNKYLFKYKMATVKMTKKKGKINSKPKTIGNHAGPLLVETET